MEEREVAIGLMASAQQRMAAGELMIAAKLAERARDIFIDEELTESACAAAAAAGHARMRSGDLASGREAFEWVRAEAAKHGLLALELAASTDLGTLLELGGALEAALELHRDVLQRCRAHSDPMGTANAAGNVGRLLGRLQHHVDAEELLEESLAGFDALGHSAGVANAHICLGDLQRALGRNAEAEENFSKASELTDSEEMKPLRAMALLNVGHLRRTRNDLAGALDAFAASAELAESIGDVQGIARATMAEGMVFADRAQPEEALASFERAETAFAEMGQPGAALAASVNKAAVQCRLGRLREGQKLLESARAVLHSIGDVRAEQEVVFALCEVSLGLGEVGQTEQLLADAQGAARAVESESDGFGPRLLLRGSLLEARLAMRALLFEQGAAAAHLPDDLEPTPGEQFAVDLIHAELAVLSGDPAAEARISGLEALAEATDSPREAVAARVIRGQYQLWTGQLADARPTYLRVRALWRELHEPIPETQAQAALWWIDLLNGQTPILGEVKMLEAEVRDQGILDAADALAGLAATVEIVKSRQRTGDSAVSSDRVSEAIAPLLQRGNRLTAAVILALAAAVTEDPTLRDHASSVARGSQLSPPNVGAWRSG